MSRKNKIPPPIPDEMSILRDSFRNLKKIIDSGGDNTYYTWNEFKYRAKDPEKEWIYLKLARSLISSHLPYKSLKIEYCMTPEISRELHLCDQDLSRVLNVSSKTLEKYREFITDAIAEEAIFSSILEGAVTTEIAAKKMLKKNIPPRNKDEQMIVNNHKAMEYILDKKDAMLSPEFILEIQKIVTAGTFEDEEKSGVFRNTDDISVVNSATGDIIYTPPEASKIKEMINDLCDFINADKQHSETFVHPLIAAISLHFLIGYIHPFYDGNGRTARTLFYWYLLSRGYGLFKYIPISKIIKNSPSGYRDAYLASEEDELDLTYFILYNLRCIKKARQALVDHINNEAVKKKSFNQIINSLEGLNLRQENILRYMLDYSDEYVTIKEISTHFNVVYQTARTDLMYLTDAKYLTMKKISHQYTYSLNRKWLNKLGF